MIFSRREKFLAGVGGHARLKRSWLVDPSLSSSSRVLTTHTFQSGRVPEKLHRTQAFELRMDARMVLRSHARL